MDRDKIYEEIDELTRQICMRYNAGATGMPESVLDWMADRFIEDYEEEDTERMPDDCTVMKYMCDYLQENC